MKQVAEMERLFKALADPTRLRILGLLLTGEVCVCHIHESLRIGQPKASRHLAYLRRAGLVDTRRDGLWIHYRLAVSSDPVLRIVQQAVAHALRHVDVVQKDAERLEKKTGCCLPVVGEWQPQAAQSLMRGTAYHESTKDTKHTKNASYQTLPRESS